MAPLSVPIPTIEIYGETGSTSAGVLAAFSDLSISEVFSDVGALVLTVPKSVTGASLLDVDTDWQLSVQFPGADPMWFVSDDDESTYISDDPDTEPITVTCRSLHAVLDEAVVIPSGGVGTTPAEWAFTTATPGKIVKDLFDSAQTRSMCQNITVSGDATNDADGVAWPDTVTVTYKAGTTLLTVCNALRDALLLEYRFVGRDLELHQPGGGMDRDLDVTLRPGRDVLSAPITRSRKPQATAVLIEGESAANARRTQTLTGRRAREVYVSESDAAGADLNAIGDLYLAAHTAAEVQITHELTDADDSAPIPWVDYLVGDRIVTAAAGTSPVRRRVQQIALAMTDSGARVTLEMGSLLRTAEERMQRQIASLLPGERAVT